MYSKSTQCYSCKRTMELKQSIQGDCLYFCRYCIAARRPTPKDQMGGE